MIQLTDKQKQAVALILENRYTLLYGGSRGGKTFAEIYFIVVAALQCPSTWLVARRYAKDVKESIWKRTLKDVLLGFGLKYNKDYKTNEQDMDLKFPNGSVIKCAGLDDKERVDKILGTEFTGIFLNESQDIPWYTVRTLRTRLSEKNAFTQKWGNKLICDLNPTSSSHWTHRLFLEHVDPETLEPVKFPERYVSLQVSPYDNEENLSKEYIEAELESLSGEARKRFLLGEYSEVSELQVFNPVNYFKDADFFKWASGRENEVRFVAGLDIGYEDADALSVIAYIDGDESTWLVYEYKARKKTITELEDAMNSACDYIRKWLPQASFSIDVYGDTGGGGKKVVKEINTVFAFPIVPAYKIDKRSAIDLLQEEVNNPGRLHIRLGGPFATECGQIIWTRNEYGTIERLIDDDQFHPDSMDSVLYPFRYLWSYGNSALKHRSPSDNEDENPFQERYDPMIAQVREWMNQEDQAF